MLARLLTGRSLVRSAMPALLPMRSRAAPTVSVRALYSNDASGSGASSQPGGSGPFYANYTVYKGKAAVSVKAIAPTWAPVGQGKAGYNLKREGTLLFEFAQAVGERSYNWDGKVSIALSALELATLLDVPQEGVSLFHDPLKGTPEEGATQKTFKVQRAPDGKVWFFSLSVGGRAHPQPVNISVAITNSEFTLVKTLASAHIPYFLGFTQGMQPPRFE